MINQSNHKFRDFMLFDEAVSAVDEILATALNSASLGILNITNHLAATKGNGIRTDVLLATSLDTRGLVPKDACFAAASIEILHLATLIHDDIIDDAPIRRGAESIQSKFGKHQAVIAGDYLFCMAFATISEIYKPYQSHADLISNFTQAVSKICLGELLQYKNNWNIHMTAFDYLRIISGKTATLFYIASYGGSIISGCSDRESSQIAKFGKYLGMIFQIVDDCKDYKLTEQAAKKPVKSDLASGVITLPLIITFAKNPHLRDIAKDAIFTDAGRGLLFENVYKCDAISDSLDLAKKYANKSEKILERINNQHKKQELYRILAHSFELAMK